MRKRFIITYWNGTEYKEYEYFTECYEHSGDIYRCMSYIKRAGTVHIPSWRITHVRYAPKEIDDGNQTV